MAQTLVAANSEGGRAGRQGGLVARPARPASSRPRSVGPAGTGLLLVLPAVVLGVVFFAIPVGVVVYESMRNAPLVGASHFVGFSNFRLLFDDPNFRHSLLFTLLYTAIATPMIVVTSYALAVLVRTRRRAVGVLRVIFLLPYVVGLSTLSYMEVLELQPQYGGVDALLSHLGIGQVDWLIRPGMVLLAACVLCTWFASGFGMILFMTAMQGIPTDLIESAQVDGAGWWQREHRVVLPLVRRTLALVSITTCAGSLLAFSQFYIFTQGGPGSSTATSVILVYQTALWDFKLGYSCAMSVVLLVIVAGFSVSQFFLFRANAVDK